MTAEALSIELASTLNRLAALRELQTEAAANGAASIVARCAASIQIAGRHARVLRRAIERTKAGA